MKKLFCIVLAVLALWMCLALPALATGEEVWEQTLEVTPLRAGGGGSAGGSGGGGSGGGSAGGSTGGTGARPVRGNGTWNPFAYIPLLVILFISAFGGGILYRCRLSKYARNTERLIAMLSKKDNAWKYQNLQKQLKEIFLLVQKSWSEGDMTPALAYMSEDLFNNHQHQLEVMKANKQQNVLKRIRLVEAIPVALWDHEDDSKDYVWFYVKGRMVDYMIDTETGMRIKGSKHAKTFVEYWQLTRTGKTLWVLNKILQKDQGHLVNFEE